MTTVPASSESTPPTRVGPLTVPRRSIFDRLDAFVSRLSTRSVFWNKLCSMIWLPYAFRSGIRMKRLGETEFTAELPFRRFNRNWYNAMAGAALLGNSEIAGGTYVFGVCGADYTVVCKELSYKFLRPCLGPAIYRITPREDIKALVASGAEFNVTLDLEIFQAALPERIRSKAEAVLPKSVSNKVAAREKRVGKAVATFHVTPKSHQVKKGRTVR